LKPIRYLVFDLDGTLIDSSEGVIEAVNYSLRMMHQPEQPPERIKRFIGFPLSSMYPHFTDAPVSELHRHFQTRAAETIVASTVLLDGVDDTLRALNRVGLGMAVATTKIRRHVESILDKFDWRELFDVVVGGDEVEHVKPAPDALHLVLQRLKAKPWEGLVIGDTVNDIEAARAVPMISVAVESPYGGRTEVEASRPDFFIKSVADLPSLLKQIAR
jgi:2-phosphoglycolate phosphatase